VIIILRKNKKQERNTSSRKIGEIKKRGQKRREDGKKKNEAGLYKAVEGIVG